MSQQRRRLHRFEKMNLRKVAKAGAQTRDLQHCRQVCWPLAHRESTYRPNDETTNEISTSTDQCSDLLLFILSSFSCWMRRMFLMLQSTIAGLFMIFMDVSSLIKFVSFLKWIFYGFNMISFLVFRFHKKYRDIPRPLKVCTRLIRGDSFILGCEGLRISSSWRQGLLHVLYFALSPIRNHRMKENLEMQTLNVWCVWREYPVCQIPVRMRAVICA